MRKIFSIMVALGLILGLVMIAAPAAAQVCEEEPIAQVDLSDPCACAGSVYNITFNITASLTEGYNHICVEFPAGTTVPTEFDDEAIIVGWSDGTHTYPVFGDEVTVTGTKVCFLVPETIPVGEILVQFTVDAGIENPCVDDTYELMVWTDRAPDSTPVMGEYDIYPLISVLSFRYNFQLTYPNIAKGFVPPFKACGQNISDPKNVSGYNTTFNETGTGGWFDPFRLELLYAIPGCAAPCTTAKVWFELVSCPTGEQIDLQLDGVDYTLNACNITKTVGKYDATTDWTIDDALTLDNVGSPAGYAAIYYGYLHFSSPGDYDIAVYLECPKSSCPECAPGGIVASKDQVFNVYQEKDAYKFTLCEKWNLISLPLVPLGTTGSIAISDALKSAAIRGSNSIAKSVIRAIWYYDAFTGEWLHWAVGATDNTLTTLEDGKAYWVYVAYPLVNAVDTYFYVPVYGPSGLGSGAGLTCCDSITWWVWGTQKPVPYNPPSAYNVVEGWNMVGFTELFNKTPHDYLWNWVSAVSPAPVVYGYTKGCWNVQTWQFVDFTANNMTPGSGSWIAFPHAGTVYVP